MIQAFITATASSAVFYSIAERMGYLSLKPRSNSPLGLFSRYDGNIIGGALLGAGMAISGACPGTMLVQIGAGVTTGLYALAGAVLGGIIYTGFVGPSIKKRNDALGSKTQVATMNDGLGMSKGATIAVFETLCIGLVAGTTLLTPAASEPLIPGYVGGLLIGSAQLFSMLTRRSMMGVSGSYEEIGKHFWAVVGGGATPGSGNIMFASGMLAGAFGLAKAMPELVEAPVAGVNPAMAVLGGCSLVVGSRIAGGCTSGHGISGISLLSISSVITIASAFAVGGALAMAL